MSQSNDTTRDTRPQPGMYRRLTPALTGAGTAGQSPLCLPRLSALFGVTLAQPIGNSLRSAFNCVDRLGSH